MITCCKYYVPAYLRFAGTFRIKTLSPELFLTFDDGPSPKTTPVVLDMLRQAQAKATFFCVGKNVKKLREEKGLTQLELSHLIGHKSVSIVSLAEIYHKKQHFNISHLAKIAKVLDINICKFFEGIN